MNDWPFFSVIVATHERPEQLSSCLGSLAALEYPRDRFEVIVVDDGSSVPPIGVVDRTRHTMNVTLLSQGRGGPGAARNAGASKAMGHYLAFTDDDCIVDPGWLRAFAVRVSRDSGCAIGGRTMNLLIRNPYSSASQAIVDLVYAYYNADPNRARFFSGNNFALPTEGFLRMGGFDAGFGTLGAEDRDLCDRWLLRGHRMTFVSDAIVYHQHVLTLRSFWRQHANYGGGAYRFYRARARRGSGPFKPDLAFHLSVMRRQFPPEVSIKPAFTTLLVWQLANAAGFLQEALTS